MTQDECCEALRLGTPLIYRPAMAGRDLLIVTLCKQLGTHNSWDVQALGSPGGKWIAHRHDLRPATAHELLTMDGAE